MALVAMDADTFVQAANYTKGRSGARIDLIVIHDMEAPEKSTTAEAVGRYFAQPTTQASCHYNVDDDSIVQSVLEADTAWHAPGVNQRSIGIEHAGYARQTREEWLDAFSTACLRRSAALAADICKRWDIPACFVDPAGILAGERGITTHWDVTKAYPNKGSHTDPGPNFPLELYLQWVNDFLTTTTTVASEPTKDVVKPTQYVWESNPNMDKTALVTVQPVGYSLGLAEFDFGVPLACLKGLVVNGPSPNDGDGWWDADFDVKCRAQVRGSKVVITGYGLKRPVSVYVNVQTAT